MKVSFSLLSCLLLAAFQSLQAQYKVGFGQFEYYDTLGSESDISIFIPLKVTVIEYRPSAAPVITLNTRCAAEEKVKPLAGMPVSLAEKEQSSFRVALHTDLKEGESTLVLLSLEKAKGDTTVELGTSSAVLHLIRPKKAVSEKPEPDTPEFELMIAAGGNLDMLKAPALNGLFFNINYFDYKPNNGSWGIYTGAVSSRSFSRDSSGFDLTTTTQLPYSTDTLIRETRRFNQNRFSTFENIHLFISPHFTLSHKGKKNKLALLMHFNAQYLYRKSTVDITYNVTASDSVRVAGQPEQVTPRRNLEGRRFIYELHEGYFGPGFTYYRDNPKFMLLCRAETGISLHNNFSGEQLTRSRVSMYYNFQTTYLLKKPGIQFYLDLRGNLAPITQPYVTFGVAKTISIAEWTF